MPVEAWSALADAPTRGADGGCLKTIFLSLSKS